MNQRTAKLINAYARRSELRPRDIKRAWNATPRPQRAQARLEMREHLARLERLAAEKGEHHAEVI